MKLKLLIAFIMAATACAAAFAEDDPETHHVRVILADGDTVIGYIRSDLKTGLKNMFSKTGSIRQYINIGKEPKGGETKRYSAKEVQEYRFLMPTEGWPDGALYVSEIINTPGMFKPLHFDRGFAQELNRRDSGAILGWNVWETTGGRNSVSRLVPGVGIKLKGARGAFIIMANGLFNDMFLRVYLKKKYPALLKAWEEYYYKGKDAKAHRQELVDNPSTALMFYEEFLRSNPPIDDPDAEKE